MPNSSLMGRFVRYIAANVLGMLGLSCYILADTFFISQRLGGNGLAALNLAIPMYSLVSGVGLMTGIGSATQYAHLTAEGREEEADRVFTRAVLWGAAAGLCSRLRGCFFQSP